MKIENPFPISRFAFVFSFFAFFSVLFTLFFSCSNSIDDLVENYNSKYQQGTSGYDSANGLAPGEEGFVAEEMLASKYFIRSDGTLNLYAPPRCESYKWSLSKIEIETAIGVLGDPVDIKLEKEVSFNLSNGSTSSSRGFVLYVPTSSVEIGTYKLSLTVTDKEGTEYTDSCVLIVYLAD